MIPTPKMPFAQTVYGRIVYWVTIFSSIICMIGPVVAMANPDGNVVNPHFLFRAIFDGKSAEEVWQQGGGHFPGGHFYFGNLGTGDGLTQFGLALGCSVALWALLAAAASYFREKVILYAVLALWVATLVFLSASGIVNQGH
jgi:hypothetical protein